jgi:hypothetical protein
LPAYSAAKELSTTEWRKFPREIFENQSDVSIAQITLKAKGVVKQKGSTRNMLWKLACPIERLVVNGRARRDEKPTKTTATATIASKDTRSAQPFKPPSLNMIFQFISAVDRLSRDVAKARSDELSRKIKVILNELLETEDSAREDALINEAKTLNEARRTITTTVVIETIREVSEFSEFQGYQWRRIVSLNPEDYADAR